MHILRVYRIHPYAVFFKFKSARYARYLYARCTCGAGFAVRCRVFFFAGLCGEFSARCTRTKLPANKTNPVRVFFAATFCSILNRTAWIWEN